MRSAEQPDRGRPNESETLRAELQAAELQLQQVPNDKGLEHLVVSNGQVAIDIWPRKQGSHRCHVYGVQFVAAAQLIAGLERGVFARPPNCPTSSCLYCEASIIWLPSIDRANRKARQTGDTPCDPAGNRHFCGGYQRTARMIEAEDAASKPVRRPSWPKGLATAQ